MGANTTTLAGSYAGEQAIASADTTGGVLVTIQAAPCFCRGTAILTDRGEVAVEDLTIGDAVVTHAGPAARIRWIGRRSFFGRFLAGRPNLLPVRFHAGALGGGAPRRDLLVSPEHAMFLDGVLIPARALVNGVTIRQEVAAGQVDYFHVELDRHDVIWAEGAASETFIDDDSRAMFQNAAEHEALGREPATSGLFAPWCESGFVVEAVRRRLAALEVRTAA